MSGAGERPAARGKLARSKAKGSGGPFLLPVHALRSQPGRRQAVHLCGELPELASPGPGYQDASPPATEGAPGAHPAGPAVVPAGSEVCFDGFVESALGGVTVAGLVTAPYVGICRRCLEVAAGTLTAEVRELCLDPREARSHLGEEEDDYYPVGQDELDFEPMVRDACILELPLAPLCSESCRGLCPRCGANRNREPCSCEESFDPRRAGSAGLSSSGADERPHRSDQEAEQDTE